MREFRASPAVEDKGGGAGGFDPVTEADRMTERYLRRELSALFPVARIVGEEGGTTGAGRPGPVGDRPYRRHQGLHHRRAHVGRAPRTGRRRTPRRRLVPSALPGRDLRRGRRPGLAGSRRPAAEPRHPTDNRSGRRLHVLDPPEHVRQPMGTSRLRGAGRPGSSAALRRRLLLVLPAGPRCHRSGRRGQPPAVRHRAPDPDRGSRRGVVTGPQGQAPLEGGFVVAAATPELHAQALDSLRAIPAP